jgi:hypothetical protein
VNFVLHRRQLSWQLVLLVTVLTCLGAAQTPTAIRNLASKGTLDGMRWADFRDYQPWLQKFCEPTGYSCVGTGNPAVFASLPMIAQATPAFLKGLADPHTERVTIQALSDVCTKIDVVLPA